MYIHYTRRLLDKAIAIINASVDANRLSIGLTSSEAEKFAKVMQNVIAAIENTHPYEADLLEGWLPQLFYRQSSQKYKFNVCVFGEVSSLLSVLNGVYYEAPKIFISHSSADKEIVKAFVEKILMLGCGFEKDDIFCTLDADAIELGDDFRNSIIDNMRCCDYIFLMISENYRKSEICHNEVGAAWALQDTKRVIPLKFPNINFSQEDLGMLNVVKQAGSLDNKQQIIKIYEELCKVYDIRPNLSRFVQYMDDFIEIVNTQNLVVKKGTKAKAN